MRKRRQAERCYAINEGRVPRHRRDDRGTTMVEAAFVTPVFILLLMGIIEFSGYISATTGANAATKAGARMATVQGRAPWADREILKRMDVEGAGLVASNDTIDEIRIWRASSPNENEPSSCTTATKCNSYLKPNQSGGAYGLAKLPLTSDDDPPSAMGTGKADCYFGSATTADTRCTGTSRKLDANWPPLTRRVLEKPPGKSCNDTTKCPPDLVGIWIKVTHRYYTGFFGSSVTVTSKAVVPIEPQGYDR